MEELAEGRENPLPSDQLAMVAERKAESTPPKVDVQVTYVMKAQKRKNHVAFAIHNRTTKKQIAQLMDNVVEEADKRVSEVVKELNDHTLSEDRAIEILTQLKSAKAN